jgi:predicted O-linked N-acetylglucosamine transferase (SPINDLY family)
MWLPWRNFASRAKLSRRVLRGQHLLFAAVVLIGPRYLRDAYWKKYRERLHWSWLSIDRPLHGPGWLDRWILDWALRRLQAAKGEDRLLLLQLIMHHAYACDVCWHPNFADAVAHGNSEFLRYLFTFPIFMDSLSRQDRIIGFIQRLYADLDRLYATTNEPAIRAEIAGHVAQHYSFMPTLFSDATLRPIAQTAGRWLESYLRSTGHRLEHEFPERAAGTRLRVGVLVHDIEPRNESFLALPFGLGLDRNRFEPVLVTGQPPSACAFGALVEKAFERIEVITTDSLDEQVAAVRSLNLDFLVLANTIAAQTSRQQHLFAHRLARRHIMPVAISPCTTGLSTTDIVLTAANTETRDEAEQHYTETVHWLDGTFNCFAFGPRDPRLAQTIKTGERINAQRPIVFASGGVIYKLGPALRQSFIRILQRVPESELLLYPFNPNWMLNPKVLELRQAMLNEFTAAGIAPDRVRILPAITPAQILQMMHQVTVYLDTFPFSGGASVIEPIFASCPIVTLRGRTQRGLLGAGMMRSLGMNELVADNVADYEEKAIEIARSPERRAALSERLRLATADAPFLDPIRFGRHLGAALERLAAPSLLSVAADDEI